MPILLVTACLCLGQAENPRAVDVDVERLVRQYVQELEDRQRATRDDAERKLAELGPDVLPLLPTVDARTSGELKQRLERIRLHLEKLQAEKSAEGSRVTLEGKMSLDEAFAALQQQTGNRIVDYRDRVNQPTRDIDVEVNFDQRLYWEALDELLDQADLTIFNLGGEARALAVTAKGEGALPRAGHAAYNGLFRIEATNLFAERDLRNPQNSRLRLTLEVIWEPRVLPILIRQNLEDIQLQGDQGQSLSLAATGTIQVPVQSTVSGVDIHLPLELPSRDVKRIGSIRGRFSALVPGRVESFEFENLDGAREVEQRRAGLSVVLDRVRKNGAVHEIRVRLRLDQASDSLQSHLDWVSNNEAILLDAEGKPADEPNFEKYLERANEVGFAYLFPVEGDLTGYKFIYKTPAAIVDMPVEYELKDVDLP